MADDDSDYEGDSQFFLSDGEIDRLDQGVEAERSTTILRTPRPRKRQKLDPEADMTANPSQSPGAQGSPSASPTATPRTQSRLDDLSRRFRKVLDDLTISQDSHLANTRRLKELLDGTQLYSIRARPKKADIERSIASVLSVNPLPGRKVIANKKPSQQKGFQTWKMELKDISGSKTFFDGELTTLQVGYAVVPSDQRKAAEQLLEFIANWFNRWPSPTIDLHTKRSLIAAAVNYFLPKSRTAVARPRWEKSDKNNWYVTRVWRIDPTTHKAVKRLLTIAPNERVLKNAREAPDLPEDVVLFDWVKGGSKAYLEKDATGQWPSVSPNPLPEGHSAKAHALVVKFLYFVTPKLEGIVATEERLLEIYNYWKQKYGFSTGNDLNSTLGPYGGQHLLNAFRNKAQRVGHLRIGPLLAKDIGIPFQSPMIIVRSLLGTRIALPLDIAYRVWIATGDPRLALLAAAEAADRMNKDIAEGHPPVAGCDCTAAQALEEFHPCAICFQLVLCNDLHWNIQHARVCQAHPYAAIDTGVAEQVIRRSLRENLSNELRRHGEDPFSEKNMKIFNDALPEVLASIVEGSNGTQYVDSYTNESVALPVETESKARSIHPDICSVDAIMPRAPTGDGRYKAHVRGNLAVTRGPTNMFKWTHLPGWLALAGEWMRLKPEDRTLERAREFMARVDELHLVMTQVPYFHKSRAGETITDEEYARQFAQFVSGRVPDDEREFWQSKAFKFVTVAIPPVDLDNEDSYIWMQMARACLTSLAKQWQRLYGIELQWSADECPYPGLSGCMEPLWTWNAAAVFCRDRRERLRILCNRRHVTLVNEYQIFASLLKSACIVLACLQGNCPDPKNHGPAHFPFRLAIKHPLRVAIGHLHHKEQMTFEWLQDIPDDINNVDPSLNQVLIEPSTLNWLRWDNDEKFWPQLLANAAASTVKLRWFNPDASPTIDTGVTRAVSDLTYDADVDEDFQGLEFELDEEEAEADALAHPEAHDRSTKPAFDPARQQFGLASTDYEGLGSLEGETALVPPGHMMYGRVVASGHERGFARVDGTFRTASDEIVGAFMQIGTKFEIFGHLTQVDSPLPYLGPLMVRKAAQADQVSNMVSSNSLFYEYVLVNRGLNRVGHATSNRNFVAKVDDGEEVLGRFDEATGDIFDHVGSFITNIAYHVDADWYIEGDKTEDDAAHNGKEEKAEDDAAGPDRSKDDNGRDDKGKDSMSDGLSSTSDESRLILTASMFVGAYGEHRGARIVAEDHPLYGVIVHPDDRSDVLALPNPGLADGNGRFQQPQGSRATVARWVQEDPLDAQSRFVVTDERNGVIIAYVERNDKGVWGVSKP